MGQPLPELLKLGRISYLNVLPIYHPLESGIIAHPFEIVPGIPAYLNHLMADGELDLSVVSSIEYARHRDRYLILPDLSISSRGPVRSVLLLSRYPIEDLDRQSILVTTQSHTSVVLLKILFNIFLKIKVNFVPGDCTEVFEKKQSPAAFLAIGDEALRARSIEGYPHCYDLGEQWFSRTGFPFVFAVWVIQRKCIARMGDRLEEAIEALASAKRWGQSHSDEICRLAQQKGVLGFGELQEYYRLLVYDLGSAEQKGLERFFDYLPQIGEAAEVPRLEIYSPVASVA